MNEEIIEWWKKAEGDYLTMRRESTPPPNFDAVCFHAQQCVEKLLKAYLIFRSIHVPYTHNLIVLLDLIQPPDPRISELWEDLKRLSDYGVSIRYPNEFASEREA